MNHLFSSISRRSFVTGLLSTAIAAITPTYDVHASSGKGISLKERANQKGLIYGVSVKPYLLKETAYANVLRADAGMIVAGNALKWGPLAKRRHMYDFTSADEVAEFSRAHDMLMRGHTFIWHKQIPKWLPNAMREGSSKSENIIVRHIETIGKRYRGRMFSWDVVNEAIEPKHGRTDGLRDTLFLKSLGQDYLELSFRIAHEADPNARLIINEYGLEAKWRTSQKRRDCMLRLLEKLLSKGVPIHGVGLQGHLSPGRIGSFDAQAVARFCDEVENLGLEIHVTELDAKDNFVSGDVAVRDQAVADAFTKFLEVVLKRTATKSVTTWGISDRYSWLNTHFPRSDGEVTRGLPYDIHYNPKLAWYALANAFDNAPIR